jgi:eukaryotic-like serine/threonine-protein kinase
MAAIDRERWTVLEPLLDEALELTPEERVPWLEALNQSAPDVAAELNALLTGDASADREGFLTRPLDLTLEGVTIGAYTLERMLGHGGMGSVWLAKRTDGRFEGRAAVKLLNLSLLSASGQDRFRREGSILARLAHPGIASLLDAGVSRGGQPYLVLEYVDGKRLDVYAAERTLALEDRIRLFLGVLDAVGHAHANLIVHRDLKPSNILVTSDGRVKLLDFGIAKLTGDELAGADATAVTIDGARVFTPQFAAPEQVRGEPITTATDVYALGVILYMLIAERHPTGHESKTAADFVRTLSEVQPAPLAPRDLDRVVGKALRKEQSDRYQNVRSFADDLERFLRHEPVSVGRDALVYRARKFALRHRAAVAVGSATLGVLFAATAFSASQMREARRQRDGAIAAGRRADAQAEFATLLVSQAGEKPITNREMLDRARDGIERQYAGDPRFVSAALLELSSHYGELGDSKTRAAVLARAESISLATHDTTRLIEIRCNIADELRTEGKHKDAEQLLNASDSLLRRFPDPSVEATCRMNRAWLENEMGHPEKSAPAILRAIAIRDSLGQTRDMFYVTLLDGLAYTFDRQNRIRDAIAVDQRVIALLDSTGRGRTATTAVFRHNLAVLYNSVGDVAEASRILHDGLEVMGPSDPNGRVPQQFLIHYAHAALYQGDADSARKYFAMLADQSAAEHNDYWKGRALFGLAQAELMLGRMSDARKTTEQFRDISGNPSLIRSDDQVVNVNTLDALAALAAGDTVKGNALVRQTLTKYGYFTGKRSRTLHSTLILAARTAIALHHPDSALTFARDARKSATRDSLTETESARVGEARLLEASAELAQGDRAAARGDAGRALIALRRGGGASNPRTHEAEALVARLR